MNLSHKLTFSLVCFVVLFAFAAMPAMAQTISAEWTDDLNEDNTTDDPGWSVTIGGLSDNAGDANDDPAIAYLDVNLAAAAGVGTQTGFDAVADSATESEGTIAATLGTQIAVQVTIAAAATTVYQRVTFPVAGPGAQIGPIDLALLPQLMDLATPLYYAQFGDMVTVTFNFATPPATTPTIGDPVADLHVSDVTLGTPADWQYISVSKDNAAKTRSITYRSTHAADATSVTTTVTIRAAFAGEATTPADGVATIHYDNTAPTVTADTVAIAAPPGFGTPPDGVWNSTFVLTFSISDDADGSGLPDSSPVRIDTDTTKLNVDSIGLGTQDDGVAGTEYLVRITPKADRVTTAGEPVLITIVPIDSAGNEGSSITSVKLAEMTAPAPVPAAYMSASPSSGNVMRSGTITVTFDKDPGTLNTGNANVTASGSGNTRTLMVSATAPAGALALSLTWNDGGGPQVLNYTVVIPDSPAIAFTSADPASGATVMPGDMITLTFAADPGTVTATVGTIAGSGATRTLTIPADQAAGAVMTTVSWMMAGRADGSQVLNYTVDVPPEPIGDGTINIPANSFVVVVRNNNSAAPGAGGLAFRSDVMVRVWAEMPDLQYLFDRTAPHGGGALVLTGAGINVGTVGISEIMWARDISYIGNEVAEKASQWIELHNLNSVPVNVSIKVLMGTAITDAANGLREGLASPNIDAVTNFFNNRPGHAAWDVKGSDGDSLQARNFVAMGRIRPDTDTGGGVRLEPYANANLKRYSNRDGRAAGSWNAFSTTYLVARTSTNNVEYRYVGTPGRVNDYAPATQGDLIVGRNYKPASNNIIINEVGNREDDRYSWIELRNASGGEINLRNYIVTKVTAVDTETVIYRFPANDNIKLASNAVFLLLSTDPADDTDHPIAATGYNVDKPAQEQVPGTPNSPVRYKVVSFELPDDGNVVLMVRRPDNHENFGPNAHGGKGASETGSADLDKIVDIAGYHSNLAKSSYPNSVSSTNLWPLWRFDAPGFTNNKFEKDKVHQRNRTSTNNDRSGVGAQDNNNGKTAFGDRGWTGVGYRRMAAQNAANGGTPGYPNGANPRSGGIKDIVYISEIMYADDARGSLAQWIELRNPSNTMGADLTNWRLTITNHDSKNEAGDAFTGTSHTEDIMLNGLEIPPNSAVLITSRQGPRTDVHLPDGHIFVLYPTHRNALGMANATSDILNPYGFNIRIQANAHDKNKRHEWQMVDEVGNLAARRTASRGERTDTERYDDPRWMLPNAMTEDGARISIARTNKRGGTQATGFTPSDGKMESGWILSNMDMRTDLISPTYYGHRDDWSTPGQTKGQPLPVELSSFRPTLENGKVTIQWTTESELDNAGFNILRSDTRDGEFTKVNEQMIQGKGTTAERTTYKWVDTTAKPGAVYYYQIEDVSFAGQHNTLATTKLKGLISAKGKLTTQWGDLKNLR